MNFPMLLLAFSRAVLGLEASAATFQLFVAVYHFVAAGAKRYLPFRQGQDRVEMVYDVHYVGDCNSAGDEEAADG